jgi:hydrogenase small subunit
MAAAGVVGAGVAAHAAISALKSAQKKIQSNKEEA